MSTACVIIIGNEILSGRTQDINLNWLAKELNAVGVRLLEARIIPDITDAIIKTLNECRAVFDYVFTTGGIGPTHDDITSEAVAQAFGVKYGRNKEAEALLTRHYNASGSHALNEARLKMADMPEGATLIPNPVSIAPGFILGNVYVMAGVPGIMQAMFDGIKHTLKGGKPMLSATVSVFITEGNIASRLTQTQKEFPDVEIGSYPFMRAGKLGTSLVARHTDKRRLEAARNAISGFIRDMGGEIIEDE